MEHWPKIIHFWLFLISSIVRRCKLVPCDPHRFHFPASRNHILLKRLIKLNKGWECSHRKRMALCLDWGTDFLKSTEHVQAVLDFNIVTHCLCPHWLTGMQQRAIAQGPLLWAISMACYPTLSTHLPFHSVWNSFYSSGIITSDFQVIPIRGSLNITCNQVLHQTPLFPVAPLTTLSSTLFLFTTFLIYLVISFQQRPLSFLWFLLICWVTWGFILVKKNQTK